MKSRLCVWLLAALVILPSCLTVSRVTNLTPTTLLLEPSISSFLDPDSSTVHYKTFSVFPLSVISDKVTMNAIMEKQALFFLRNCLEFKGYRFVPLDQGPDFLATIDLSAPYRESYVPPQTVTTPVWVPGRTVTTYGNTSGNFNYNTYGNYSSYGWGSYSGQTTATTYVPGYVTTESYTRSGYTTGHYYPTASVSLFDAKTLKHVWLGVGVGTSNNPDPRVSAEGVVTRILTRYPSAFSGGSRHSRGFIGVQVAVFTNDGNLYFPTLISLAQRGPAEKAGLLPHDMLLAINGVGMANTPLVDVLAALEGDPDTQVTFEVWRNGKRFNLQVTRGTSY